MDQAIQKEFDFIVVGGGSAGCVMAARLAESGRFSVALIEAGRVDSNRWIHMPATFFKALQSQDATAYISENDPTLNDRKFAVPQGRVLGGGSSVNGMIYMRGQAQDYDDWESEHGCTGWSYKDVLPIFCRQERNTRLGAPYHGHSGRLVVDDPSLKHAVTEAIIASAVEAGIPKTKDFNGAQQEGVGWYQVTASQGKRQSAAVCFLRPLEKAENLTIFTSSKAQKIRIENRRAVGVDLLMGDKQVSLKATKEVILTAGSFESPKLLMLSGIGPTQNLERVSIDVIADRQEVGANLQDHIGAPVTMKLKKPIGLFGANKGLKALKHGLDYFVFNKGLLTSNLLEAGACVDTDGDGRPDVQYNLAPFAPGDPGSPPLEVHGIQVHPMTMRPKSRSQLQLSSADASVPLAFASQVLRSDEDMDTLRRGVRLAREILSQKPIADMVSTKLWPGPGVSSLVGSNNLDDAIRNHARTIFHPAGTCRMGGDKRAVVDPQLRVNEVECLRVADCSVMPQLISGNTNAPTMMIAERAAEWILADHR